MGGLKEGSAERPVRKSACLALGPRAAAANAQSLRCASRPASFYWPPWPCLRSTCCCCLDRFRKAAGATLEQRDTMRAVLAICGLAALLAVAQAAGRTPPHPHMLRKQAAGDALLSWSALQTFSPRPREKRHLQRVPDGGARPQGLAVRFRGRGGWGRARWTRCKPMQQGSFGSTSRPGCAPYPQATAADWIIENVCPSTGNKQSVRRGGAGGGGAARRCVALRAPAACISVRLCQLSARPPTRDLNPTTASRHHPQCADIVNGIAPALFDWLRLGTDAQEMCAEVGVCGAQRAAGFLPVKQVRSGAQRPRGGARGSRSFCLSVQQACGAWPCAPQVAARAAGSDAPRLRPPSLAAGQGAPRALGAPRQRHGLPPVHVCGGQGEGRAVRPGDA